ncbi:hypothetical protein R3P38DRAFT_1710277 [Favolaschia claudopus]|uniref:Uncharacterized protein n=1 Tax=Favolaschia claudopus TaxID=2862362 RepID=A0AAW0AAM1_9AGAR
MLSLRPNYLAFLFLSFLALSPVNAAPVVVSRQTDGQTTTVMTQSTTSTPAGDMTQTCVITLTPIKDDQGNDAVRQVKTCKLTMGGVNNSGNNGNNGGTNGGNDNGGGNNGGDASSTAAGDNGNGGSATDSSGSASTASSGGGIIVNGVSSVSATPTDSAGGAASTDSAGGAGGANSASATPTPGAPAEAGAAAVSAGELTSIPLTAVSTGGVLPTGAAAAADQSPSPSSSSFTVPGQKIQVLPIGLGVFAGISVIALIVVGLVTYERTKYRKAFRARKLAESGAGMGYGGMAQR